MIFKLVSLSLLVNIALLATAKENLRRRLLNSGGDVLELPEYQEENLACQISCCVNTCFTYCGWGTNPWGQCEWHTTSYECDNNGNYVVVQKGPVPPKPRNCHETGPVTYSKILSENSNCCFTTTEVPTAIPTSQPSTTPTSVTSQPSTQMVTLDIEIDSCDDWIYIPERESLQIQFSGFNGISTRYETINKNKDLAVNGDRETFTITTYNIGDLESISLSMNDNPGYCLKNVSVYGFNQDRVFKKAYFGNGVILAQDCPYSYYQLSSSLPLISCVAAGVNDEFTLFVNSPRGIYELGILSCNVNNDNYGNIKKGKLHASIMGQTSDSNEYITINEIYLDYLLAPINRDYEQFEIIEFYPSDPNDENSLLNWNEANDQCKELYNTELASIGSESQEKLIHDKIKSEGKNDNRLVFIGLKNTDKADPKWVDGSQLYYKKPIPYAYHGCTVDINDITRKRPYHTGMYPITLEWYGQFCEARANYWWGWWDEVHYYFYICNTPKWSKNIHRIFEINVETDFDEIDLVSITNDDKQNAMCIDEVFINGKRDIYSDTYRAIGGDEYEEDTLVKVFSYPVCKTEIIGIANYEIIETIPNEKIVIGGGDKLCKNYDRVHDLTCEISVEKSVSTETVITLSSTDEYSWGTSTSKTNGAEGEDSMSLTVNQGIEGGPFTMEAEVSQSWTYTEYSEKTNENNEENTQSNSNENSWTQSVTTTIECTAVITAIPGHETQYEVIYESGTSTYDVTYDVKLTPCDDSIETEIIEIPGSMQQTATAGCTITAYASVALENRVKCADHINQAIASGSTYMPKCQNENTDLYDGCQCDIGDSLTLAICWCSDELGNFLPGNVFQFDGSFTDDQVCVEQLKCDNTERVYQ